MSMSMHMSTHMSTRMFIYTFVNTGPPTTLTRTSYGLYSYGIYSYGRLYRYGLYSYGRLYRYGLYSYGLYDYGYRSTYDTDANVRAWASYSTSLYAQVIVVWAACNSGVGCL